MELRFTEKNFKWLLHVDHLMKENEDEFIRNLLLFGFAYNIKKQYSFELPIK